MTPKTQLNSEQTELLPKRNCFQHLEVAPAPKKQVEEPRKKLSIKEIYERFRMLKLKKAEKKRMLSLELKIKTSPEKLNPQERGVIWLKTMEAMRAFPPKKEQTLEQWMGLITQASLRRFLQGRGKEVEQLTGHKWEVLKQHAVAIKKREAEIKSEMGLREPKKTAVQKSPEKKPEEKKSDIKKKLAKLSEGLKTAGKKAVKKSKSVLKWALKNKSAVGVLAVGALGFYSLFKVIRSQKLSKKGKAATGAITAAATFFIAKQIGFDKTLKALGIGQEDVEKAVGAWTKGDYVAAATGLYGALKKKKGDKKTEQKEEPKKAAEPKKPARRPEPKEVVLEKPVTAKLTETTIAPRDPKQVGYINFSAKGSEYAWRVKADGTGLMLRGKKDKAFRTPKKKHTLELVSFLQKNAKHMETIAKALEGSSDVAFKDSMLRIAINLQKEENTSSTTPRNVPAIVAEKLPKVLEQKNMKMNLVLLGGKKGLRQRMILNPANAQQMIKLNFLKKEAKPEGKKVST